MSEACEHKYIFLRTAKDHDNQGGYNTRYWRVDTFYCEKCLHERKIKKEEYSRDTPEWYRGI